MRTVTSPAVELTVGPLIWHNASFELPSPNSWCQVVTVTVEDKYKPSWSRVEVLEWTPEDGYTRGSFRRRSTGSGPATTFVVDTVALWAYLPTARLSKEE